MITLHENFLNFKRPSPHSIFSPSSADRWLITGCSYSVYPALEVPEEEESEYAKEGTLAHSVCEATFRKMYYGIPFPLKLTMQLAKLPDLGAEMQLYAEDYAGSIIHQWLNDKEKIGDVVWYGIEKGIPIFAEESCFGTGDFIIIGTKGAAVIDYKYGRKPVPAGAVQLKVYAAGLSRWIINPPRGYKFFTSIYQPRVSQATKDQEYEGYDIYNFLSVIWKSIQKAKEKNLQPCEGNHCFWCPLRRTTDLKYKCSLKLNKPLEVIKEDFALYLAKANQTSSLDVASYSTPERDAALIKIMNLYPIIKMLAEEGELELKRRMENGENIPGAQLVTVEGNRAYNEPDTELLAKKIVEKFPNVAPYEIKTTKKIKSITALEKEIGKGKLGDLVYKPLERKVIINQENQFEAITKLQGFAKLI